MSRSGRSTRTTPWALVVALGLVSLASPAMTLLGADAPVRVKLATLIPRGTPPHEILLAMGEKWRQAPCGGVTLTIYPDGVMGGEADMVKRMRVGQIQAGLLSVVGLSEIDNSVSAIQNLPFMFRSLEEVEYVREKLRPTLEKRLADKGFVALFWGDLGWVRFFSKNAAVHPADFMKMKLFTWSGSPEQVELMSNLGFHPVPLETNDILPGLQTGLIDAVDTSPLYALAGQFYGPCPHMLEINYAPLSGATVITKKAWEGICPAARAELLKAAQDAGQQVTARSRKESAEAVEAMKKRGLKVHPVPPEVEAEWRRLAEGAYPKIRGKLVPADMFDEAVRLLRDYRASGGK